jgi:spermidine synthase
MSVWDNVKLPKVLYSTDSEYNGHVEVWQSGQTTKLVADGTVQSINWDSPAAEKMVFGQVVTLLKEKLPNLSKVLVFGLAGGAMQHLLSKAFPGIEIVSVEIDPVMIEIAKQYFRLEDIPNHKVLCTDACRVVVEPEQFDVQTQYFEAVVVDIYCGDTYPDLGDSGNFLVSMKNLMLPDALAVFNRIYLNSHQDDVNAFIDVIQNHFDDVDTRTIAGKTNSDNILIFGHKRV